MTRPMMTSVVLPLCLAACGNPPAPGSTFPAGELVDLSHSYDAQTIFWPTAMEGFKLEKVADGMTPGGYYYAANNFCTAEHGGTHLDAPVHFAAGSPVGRPDSARSTDGPRHRHRRDRAASAQRRLPGHDGRLRAWEREHGPIPADAIVLLRTGFSKRWPDAARYLGHGRARRAGGRQAALPRPASRRRAWLVANRPIKAIGIDTASIDFGQSTLFESHRVLYDTNMPAFENLTNLDRLPEQGAHIIALPMKIGGGSGAPLRAVAILPR